MAYFTEEQDRQWRANQPKKVIVAKVIVKSADGKILLVKPSYKPTWQLPGGGVDAGESPTAAAVREVNEEIGVKCHEADLRLIDTIFRPQQDILIVLYELKNSWEENPELKGQEDELEAFEWVATDNVATRLPDYYAEFWQRYCIKS